MVERKCLATNVHGASLKVESEVLGFSSTCILYTFWGTCSKSLIAAAVVKLTCPDTRTGNLDDGGKRALPLDGLLEGGIGAGGGGPSIALVYRWAA